MAQPKKRFGRGRDPQDDLQQFRITDEDRDLARLVEETLPRNRAAAKFERSAMVEAAREDEELAASDAEESADLGAENAEQTAVKRKRHEDKKTQRNRARQQRAAEPQPTPLWYKTIMIGLLVVGLLWIIVYYLFQGQLPIPGIELWNLVIGLGFMLSGLIMTTRWR